MKSFESILPELLAALHWKGFERLVKEVMPVNEEPMDILAFCNALSYLGIKTTLHKINPARLSQDYFPCIYITAEGEPHLLKSPEDAVQTRAGQVILVEMVTARDELVSFKEQLRRFNPLLRQITFYSIVIGVVALSPILFNRIIYDHIIAAGTTTGLGVLGIGVLVALFVEIGLRHIRSRYLAYFGGRIDHFVSCSVFERLLYLPPLYTERASVSAQLARLRDFENVREFFTGPLAVLFFEMPLVIVYLVAMAAMAHWLALVPLALVGCYALLILLVNNTLKQRAGASATAVTKRQELLLETVTKLKAIRLAGMEKPWQQRYRTLSNEASLAAFKSSFAAQNLETASYALMTLGGVATLSFGVLAVLSGAMTIGTLIAAMILIWRIIAPMQMCCASMTRMQQLISSTRQVGRLLSLQPERDPTVPLPVFQKIKGRISFHRVSLRYSPDMEPALLGVSFDIKPGQIVAIKGNNGSGKSTLIKLVLGLYQPQSGSVRIDGIDIRQFDPVALRQNIAYVPQHVDLFPGTIRENLAFIDPSASEDELRAALEFSRAKDEIDELPEGLDTRIEGNKAAAIPFLLRQRINLARGYLKPAPIMLFDEASYSLGLENDNAFIQKIASLRGRSTVMLVTHREDHMQLADILLVMNKGELTHAGPPVQVLNVLKGKKS